MPDPDPALDELAALRGIEARWTDLEGREHTIGEDTKRALLAAMGLDVSSAATTADSLERERARPWRALVDPATVVNEGEPARLRLHVPQGALGGGARATATLLVRLRGERGEIVPLDLAPARVTAGALVDGAPHSRLEVPLPALAIGEWDVEVSLAGIAPREGAGRLFVVPARAFLPETLARGGALSGFATQLYALPDFDGGGVGTIAAAGALAASLGRAGGALLGLSPLHPTPNRAPHDHSPYCPLSRTWRNPIFLDLAREPLVWDSPAVRRLRATPRWGRERRALARARRVRYERSMAWKERALRAAHGDFVGWPAEHPERRAFARFVEEGGESLAAFAAFEALRRRFAAARPPAHHWDHWPEEFRDARSEAVARFRAEEAPEVGYHAFVQWLLDRQLSAAQAQARAAGMEVGLYHDLALGSAGHSADAWGDPQLFVRGAEAGAPPDAFQPRGQAWGVVPMDPAALRERAYEPWLRLLRAAMRHGGAVRLDHVMGLWRLWWVPRGREATDGAYVRYPAEDLLGLVALESARARCLVVGEDLGTVAPGVREAMAARQVLGYRVALFERHDGGFADPSWYPRLAVASFATHDLPTFPAWWRGRDLALRAKLGFLTAAEAARARRERRRERAALFAALRPHLRPEQGDATAPAEGGPRRRRIPKNPPVDAFHRWLASGAAAIALGSLDDALGVLSQRNVPGTLAEHPNWTGRLPFSLATLLRHPRLRAAALALRRGAPSAPAARAQ